MCPKKPRASSFSRENNGTHSESLVSTHTDKQTPPLTGFTPFCFLFCFDKLDEGKGRERSRPTVENQLQVGGGGDLVCQSIGRKKNKTRNGGKES